ncbi:DUF3925 family protein [Ectobacillus sp. sgz5001026]|uniref:DUF3925 family protein n=1 Tax=Ectobacillus sp. sgz5001026 TaxID=3242473 RepID=UPI0036D33F58
MENTQHEMLSDREFYYVLLVSMLVVVGWLFDTNALFLSKWFAMSNVILVPAIGGIIGYFAMKFGKQA